MRAHAFLTDDSGSSAAEFALVSIFFVALILMIVGLSLMIYTNSMLQFATEDAARCAAVRPSTCSSASATQTYALSRYNGPKISQVFTSSGLVSGCCKVTATANFPLNVGWVKLTVPLAANACYPAAACNTLP